MNIKTNKKLLIILLLSIISFIGFMFKLPRIFSHFDKELHFLFYFCAAFIVNYLIDKNTIGKHIIIANVLFLCGIFIEIAQQYSNTFFSARIHGNFDIEDIIFNFMGLVIFSIIWFTYKIAKKIVQIISNII
jgi:VanZ family protein